MFGCMPEETSVGDIAEWMEIGNTTCDRQKWRKIVISFKKSPKAMGMTVVM